MTCEDCGFEYDNGKACPRCGYDAKLNLIDCVAIENPAIANPLEPDLAALGKRVQAGEIGQEKLQERWQAIDKMARDGNLDARHMVGRAALMQQKYDIACKILSGLADAGHALAQLDLAHIYEEGLGVDQNAYDAISLYRLAAARGNPIALFKLAEQHGRQDGVLRRDPDLANAIMERLAEKHPDMFRRKQACGCSCGNGPTDKEFAEKTASDISKMLKYLLLAGLAAFVIYVVWTEFLAG